MDARIMRDTRTPLLNFTLSRLEKYPDSAHLFALPLD